MQEAMAGSSGVKREESEQAGKILDEARLEVALGTLEEYARRVEGMDPGDPRRKQIAAELLEADRTPGSPWKTLVDAKRHIEEPPAE